MKKTLTTLLAFASCSVAFAGTPLSLEEVTAADLAATPTLSATVALTLNIDAVAAISGNGFTGGNKVTPFFTFDGTWNDGVSGTVGVCNNGSSGSHITGLYGYGTIPGSTSNAVGIGLSTLFGPDTDWDSFESMSLVASMVSNSDGSTLFVAALSICDVDGNITTYGGSSTGFHWKYTPEGGSEIQLNQLSISGVTFSESIVSTSAIYTGALTLDEAKTLSADLIPEPTTATLSLLALAGLAARRRRK